MKAHGIMFHHFHDDHKHIRGQGSISAETLDKMLDYYSKSHNIINADEFAEKALNNKLNSNDVCLTFDDALLCQYDVAYPVLKNRGIKAFWFVYSSPLDGVLEKLEIYRHFRFSMFSDIEDFYSAFFQLLEKINPSYIEVLNDYNPDEHFQYAPFYTPNDKRFRFARDVILGGGYKYNEIMDQMLAAYNYDVNENAKLLWLTADNIKDLSDNGHIVGLHSYSHPTVMITKNYAEQRDEYETNKNQLEKIIQKKIFSVSYPCNSYNEDTLRCMNELGVTIGFRANMQDICIGNKMLEIPREDHSNIVRSMKESNS